MFLCVLGFIIWVLSAASHVDQWHCSQCGYTDIAKYLSNPELREQEARALENQRNSRQEAERLRLERLAKMPRQSLSENAAYYLAAYPSQIGIVTVGLFLVIGLTTMVVMNSPSSGSVKSIDPSDSRKSALSNAINSALSNAANAMIKAANAAPTGTNSTRFSSNATSSDSLYPSNSNKAPSTRSKKNAEVISLNANLRASPDGFSEVIDVLELGSTVEIIKQRNAWFFVKAAGSSGWLHGNTIRLSDKVP